MTAADDLNAPLGLQPKKRRPRIKIPVPQIMAGALALFLAVFVLWAIVTDDPFGGEPIAVVPANLKIAAKTSDNSGAPPPAPSPDAAAPHGVSAAPPPPPSLPSQGAASPPANTTTITIIDGKTGAKQDVLVPAPAIGAVRANGAAPDVYKRQLAGRRGARVRLTANLFGPPGTESQTSFPGCGAARRGAPLIRDRPGLGVCNDPGSAAHHFVLRCARET